MSKPEVIAIAALGKKTHYICEGDNLLWHNPKDLKRVKDLTVGYPLIMGRKTYESIGRPLPKRTNIILTRDKSYKAEGCLVANNKEEAMELAKAAPGGDRKVIIFGGSEIYNLYLRDTDTLMLTVYDSEKEGTQKFPEFENDFEKTTFHGEDVFEGDKYELVDYSRKRS